MTRSFAGALRTLACLTEVEPSALSALGRWPDEVEDEMKGALEVVRRRLALGASVPRALAHLGEAAGDDAAAVASILDAHMRDGGPLAGQLRSLADAIEQRAEMDHEARAAAVASRASARLMALLAVVFVLLLPPWRTASFPVIAGSLTIASLLVWAGARWVRRLSPRPPQADEPEAVFAQVAAGMLASGAGLDTALELAAQRDTSTLRNELLKARRRWLLGATWPQALSLAENDSLARLGRVIDRAHRSGGPLGSALQHFAGDVRRRARRDFELRARRAPVLLVLPLTLCFLPAFAIVVVVPLVRALSS